MSVKYPSESWEQQKLFKWQRENKDKILELEFLVASFNGVATNIREANRMKMEGLNAGFPDIQLPIPNGMYNGLFIELKRVVAANPRKSKEQIKWINFLNDCGYLALFCYGHEQAISEIIAYIMNKKKGYCINNDTIHLF